MFELHEADDMTGFALVNPLWMDDFILDSVGIANHEVIFQMNGTKQLLQRGQFAFRMSNELKPRFFVNQSSFVLLQTKRSCIVRMLTERHLLLWNF